MSSHLQYLRDILDELKVRFTSPAAPSSFKLRLQLSALGDVERRLIRKKILGEKFILIELKR